MISKNIQTSSATTNPVVLFIDSDELDNFTLKLRRPLFNEGYYIPEENTASGSVVKEDLTPKLSPYDINYLHVISRSTSSHELYVTCEEINQNIITIFNKAIEENFEDGIESDFSKSLINIIKRYGNEAIEEIKNIIIEGQINPAIASEALRWLGIMYHPFTYDSRLSFLEECLFNSSLYIRDGALLGISFIDDPHALSYLKEAIRLEKCDELKEEMEVVAEQLEETIQCHGS